MPFSGAGKVVKCWTDEGDCNWQSHLQYKKVINAKNCTKKKKPITYQKRFGLRPSSVT